MKKFVNEHKPKFLKRKKKAFAPQVSELSEQMVLVKADASIKECHDYIHRKTAPISPTGRAFFKKGHKVHREQVETLINKLTQVEKEVKDMLERSLAEESEMTVKAMKLVPRMGSCIHYNSTAVPLLKGYIEILMAMLQDLNNSIQATKSMVVFNRMVDSQLARQNMQKPSMFNMETFSVEGMKRESHLITYDQFGDRIRQLKSVRRTVRRYLKVVISQCSAHELNLTNLNFSRNKLKTILECKGFEFVGDSVAKVGLHEVTPEMDLNAAQQASMKAARHASMSVRKLLQQSNRDIGDDEDPVSALQAALAGAGTSLSPLPSLAEHIGSSHDSNSEASFGGAVMRSDSTDATDAADMTDTDGATSASSKDTGDSVGSGAGVGRSATQEALTATLSLLGGGCDDDSSACSLEDHNEKMNQRDQICDSMKGSSDEKSVTETQSEDLSLSGSQDLRVGSERMPVSEPEEDDDFIVDTELSIEQLSQMTGFEISARSAGMQDNDLKLSAAAGRYLDESAAGPAWKLGPVLHTHGADCRESNDMAEECLMGLASKGELAEGGTDRLQKILELQSTLQDFKKLSYD